MYVRVNYEFCADEESSEGREAKEYRVSVETSTTENSELKVARERKRE